MERKPAVAAYCRVSTLEPKKRGHGIDVQVRDATLFAQANGLFIERFYKDEGQSGVSERRRELQRLLRDCRAGRVGRVIIPSLDRLSRDVRLAENLFYEFARLGVEVLIADMPAYNGRDRKDVLIHQIREAIAEENRKDIIERLWKGRQGERAKVGPYRFHDLRHTYASYAAMAGVDLHVIAETMGHSHVAVTKRYAHLSPAYRRQELQKMAGFPSRGRALGAREAHARYKVASGKGR